ncbi:glycosyltransferase [Hymenobacter sp. DG01]|uniref:glycosyltransferase n=1 Tax=Hymenobacter sp. DG01 TaxID=2584940 RepID=UPI0015DE5290|nr:glycosyltransferase [Hymenobacter sp. DG01]
MITYNHEPFIAEAIESVLMQKGDFDLELVIGEDCSTDGTLSIINEYQRRFPNVVRVITSSHNVGAQMNFVRAYNACEGEYVAMLEGDDYWIDELKLQKQVAFLNNNRDYSICFHNMNVVHEEDNRTITSNPVNQKTDLDINDLAERNYITTASCVFRNKIVTTFPKWFYKAIAGDYCLHMLNAREGKIKYFSDIMGVYRVHSGGMWQTKPTGYKMSKWFETLQLLSQEFEGSILSKLRIAQFKALNDVLQAKDMDIEQKQLFIAANLIAITDAIKVTNVEYEIDHIKAMSMEFRIGSKVMAPVRKLLRR